jgi:hypothetical protein
MQIYLHGLPEIVYVKFMIGHPPLQKPYIDPTKTYSQYAQKHLCRPCGGMPRGSRNGDGFFFVDG